jgi:hypothetical protein
MFEIKNISDSDVTLRVKISNVAERAVTLRPGQATVTEIKSGEIRILEKRGLISCVEIEQLIEQLMKDMTETTSVDVNNDEPMDKYHVTESIEIKKAAEETVLESANKKVEKYAEESNGDNDEEDSDNEEGYVTGRWTEEEERLLKKVYPKKGGRTAAKKLNRSYKSVQKKVAQLNLKRRYKK